MLLSMLGSMFFPVLQASEKVSSDADRSSIPADYLDWESVFSDMAELDVDEETLEQWSDQLIELADHPLALNSASKEQLESLPFLNDLQTEGLAYYLYRYGPIQDIAELLLVEGFGEQELRLLRPFVYPGDTTLLPVTNALLIKRIPFGKQEIRYSIGRTVQTKYGFKNNSPSTLSYIGDPWSCGFRYGYSYKNAIQWGLSAQKDPGERWLNKQHLPDYVSAHILVREIGRIRTFVAGDFNLSFGQGLVCGQSFCLGKSLSVCNPEMYCQRIKRHTSMAESGFLRGAAIDIRLSENTTPKKFPSTVPIVSLTAFASVRRLDTNSSADTFTSISETGLHRTEQELSEANDVRMATTGVHLACDAALLQTGLTFLYWHFDKNYNPEWQPYNCYFGRGKTGANASFNYRARWLGTTWFGEIAVDKTYQLAVLSGIYIQPYSRMDLSLLYRYYSPAYNAYFANAFGEGTSIRNERGCYIAMEWRLASHVRLNMYYDLFMFPWLTYQCDEPSAGNGTGIQVTFDVSRTAAVQLRYKGKNLEKNELLPEEKNPCCTSSHKDQFQFSYSDKIASLVFQTVFNFNRQKNERITTISKGTAISQLIRYSPSSIPVSLSARVSLFDAPYYDTRIILYESALPGSFSMPVLYGLGTRFSLMLKWEITRQVSWWLKASHFLYNDREQTGTGSEMVEGNRLTEIQSLIRLNF